MYLKGIVIIGDLPFAHSPQVAAIETSGPGQNQKARNSILVSNQVSGDTVFGPSFAALPRALSESWIRIMIARAWTDTLTWDASLASCRLIFRATMPAPCLSYLNPLCIRVYFWTPVFLTTTLGSTVLNLGSFPYSSVSWNRTKNNDNTFLKM